MTALVRYGGEQSGIEVRSQGQPMNSDFTLMFAAVRALLGFGKAVCKASGKRWREKLSVAVPEDELVVFRSARTLMLLHCVALRARNMEKRGPEEEIR